MFGKIMLVNCVYGTGSTGKILRDLNLGVKKRGLETIMLYARGTAPNEQNVIKLLPEWIFKLQSFLSKLTGFEYGCSPFSTKKLIQQIKRHNPDIVNLHCINANTVNVVSILEFLKKSDIPTVITLHAEFLYTGGCAHALECDKWLSGCVDCNQVDFSSRRLKWLYRKNNTEAYWQGLKMAYSGFERLFVTAVSPWLKSRALRSPFFKRENIFVIPNGVDTTIFKPVPSDYLRSILSIQPSAKVYLHVTPNFEDPLKGGKYVVEFARRINECDRNARIVIVGYKDESGNLPSNIVTVGRTADSYELAAFYSMADATILASERETFSMVTAESLCCGTPVVGFNAGGPESICTEGYTSFVKYGDVSSLVDVAQKISKDRNISEVYTPIFSKEIMAERYISIYNLFATRHHT